MTMALIISVAVSLTLFGTALLLRAQVDRMKGYWYDKIEVSIFLCGNSSLAFTCTGTVTDDQRNAINAKLTGLAPTVQEVFYESSADAYERFKEQFEGSSILANVSPDALPESFRVKLITQKILIKLPQLWELCRVLNLSKINVNYLSDFSRF
jgi:cell division transport system permease protein